MRVVLDTNILISGCWKPGGNEWRVLELAASGRIAACVSAGVLAEYREVAARPKFAGRRECLDGRVAELEAAASRVEAPPVCRACADPDDNLLLDCAAAAGAACVVTGNLRDFPAEWEGIRVINARALLTELGEAD